jgi:hypothetical protein
MEQNPSQNINKEIDTSTYIVYGKMRNWKTLNAICMALDWEKRIYSNVNIYKNWNSIVKYLSNYAEIKKIRFSYLPGVLIIDEAWLNANSKDTFSKDNRLLQEILFLIWKKNLSLIWIAQRFESIDVNARVLADAIFQMRKISRNWNHPIFICTKQKQVGTKLEYVQQYFVDSIEYMKLKWISYDQLEESKLTKTKEVEESEDFTNKNNKKRNQKDIY